MQSRSRLTVALALIALAGLLLFPADVMAGGITTNTFKVRPLRSTGKLIATGIPDEVTWVIGDSLHTIVYDIDSLGDTTGHTYNGTPIDIDTSESYDAQYWETMAMQAKFRPAVGTASADSGAVTILFQMSNDLLYWKTLDSLVAADSLAAFKNFTMQPYRYGRFIIHNGTKTDSAGAMGGVVINTVGRW